MKILFVSDHYPPYAKGGAAISTSLLAEWFLQHNNLVSVACSELADKPWVENGVQVYPIICNTSYRPKNFLSALFFGLTIIFSQLVSAIRVLRLVRKLKPDIVNIVPSSYRFIPIINILLIFSRCPIVVDCRDYSLICPAHLSSTYMGGSKAFDETDQTHHGYRCVGYASANNFSFFSIRPFAVYESCVFNLYKYSVRFLINHFGGIKLVAVSKYVQQQLILNGFKSEKITYIYNISKTFEISSITKSEIPTFVYGGRIETDKGVWDLVTAVEILQQQGLSFLVKIAGTGGEFDSLKKYIDKNNITSISLLGHIKPNEVLSLYAESLAVIAPSRWPEPFGRYVLESISVGKPVIATRSGGVPEGVMDYVTGILIDIGDVEQLAAAMKYFIDDPEKSKLMEPAIIEQQAKYLSDFIGNQRLELYKDLLLPFIYKVKIRNWIVSDIR